MTELDQARQWIRDARSIGVLTGAGISAESGIPTFRGVGGLWKSFRPEDLATPEAFARDPRLVWEWYDFRRSLIAQAQPNPGHQALTQLEKQKVSFTLITQNVDGLHARAGSRNVLELHGSIWVLRCNSCGREWTDQSVPLAIPPLCTCGGMARPGVVWFGEMLPEAMLEAALRATSACDVFLVVGTSAIVYPAAGLIPRAKASGARVIEINIEPTPCSTVVDSVLMGPSGKILPQIVSEF